VSERQCTARMLQSEHRRDKAKRWIFHIVLHGRWRLRRVSEVRRVVKMLFRLVVDGDAVVEQSNRGVIKARW
jgi:hypothetical protein